MDMASRDSKFDEVLASAAKLQEVVPDLVLVGGTAAALHANHRVSFDHDHVLADLTERYSLVLDAVEKTDGWATSVRASHPPLTLMGSLDGVHGGIRQLRRTRPLDVEIVELADGRELRVPTLEEILRIKAFLVIERCAVRDFLDVVALADTLGIDRAAEKLRAIDDYYAVRSEEAGGALQHLVLALANPTPRDAGTIRDLPSYKGLSPLWQDWKTVVDACHTLARKLGIADT